MSEKMTTIHLAGLPRGEGYMDYGECPPADMIAIMRRRADHMRQVVATIDSAADEDFKIEVVRGKIVQHPIKTLQPGRFQ